jgi:hypothetical protein
MVKILIYLEPIKVLSNVTQDTGFEVDQILLLISNPAESFELNA